MCYWLLNLLIKAICYCKKKKNFKCVLIPSSLFGAKVSNYSIPAEVHRAGPLLCVVNHANEPSFGHWKHFRRLI